MGPVFLILGILIVGGLGVLWAQIIDSVPEELNYDEPCDFWMTDGFQD